MVTFNNDWNFRSGEEYDFEELHGADIIKVRIPYQWQDDEDNYDPPIYDSESKNKPTPRPECRYHWATCENDVCEVHEDEKQINNYRPKQVRFVIPKPSNDHPEVNVNKAQQCRDEEARFQNASEMSVNYDPVEEDPIWASYRSKCENARKEARKN